ncbi:MAG: response regulator transcription factor [Actinomycetota bacterium]|nr:response regulator transcription factor [Actinomycetota bacterium]
MPTAVLLAEPEPDTRGFLERHLAADGFEVLGVDQGDEALALAERTRPDLVLLDATLPDACGTELCQRLREGEPGRGWDRRVPVILLGDSQADAVDRVRAFARGADDFVVKPFDYDELLARMRAILRRVTPALDDRIELGALTIDRLARRVTVDGERVVLPGREYELLLKLASDPERVFTKEELLKDVWGFRSLGRTRTLDSHASRLRRKLSRDGHEYVVNEWGVGYRLLGD